MPGLFKHVPQVHRVDKGRTAWSALILLNAVRVHTEIKESPTGEDRALGYERARRCGAPSHFGLGCPTLGGLSISIPGAQGKG